ncbi:MAG: ACP S-malonyltransferase [Candidatus Omnitrophica bacterium]|nr:ACP S-malonyltransferase [Candidatus Omnitrophota bacterium]MCF7877879.1 ACP S-malonyltransferase [Candidatus Omnitrophota bacterium]
MGLSLYRNFPKAKKVFNLVDRVSGIKVSEAMFGGDPFRLQDTSVQQLAILAVSLAAYEQLKGKTGNIKFLSGLSLGEYSCLYAAGVLPLEDIVILVKNRGRAMQEAAEINPSSMFAVIGAKKQELEAKAQDLDFYIANINAPSQIVISVKKENKNDLKFNLEKEGLRVVELKVSGGFHSPFMEPARKKLEDVVCRLKFSDAEIPIVSNVTASPHSESSQIKDNLLKQLVSPVLWMDSVKYMAEKGINYFYETGPSKVLKGLLRKIDKSLKVINIEKKEDLENINKEEYGF